MTAPMNPYQPPDRAHVLSAAGHVVETKGGPIHIVRTLRHAASTWVIDGDTAEVLEAYHEACAWLVGEMKGVA